MKITPDEKGQLNEIYNEFEKHWTPTKPDPTKLELVEDDQYMVALHNLSQIIINATVDGN